MWFAVGANNCILDWCHIVFFCDGSCCVGELPLVVIWKLFDDAWVFVLCIVVFVAVCCVIWNNLRIGVVVSNCEFEGNFVGCPDDSHFIVNFAFNDCFSVCLSFVWHSISSNHYI